MPPAPKAKDGANGAKPKSGKGKNGNGKNSNGKNGAGAP